MSRLTVTRDLESPRNGWSFTLPETGVTVTAPFYKVLRVRVAAHMRANAVPLPDDFDEWLQDLCCRQSGLGSPFCGGAVAKRPDGKLPHLSLAVAKRFIETMADRKSVV